MIISYFSKVIIILVIFCIAPHQVSASPWNLINDDDLKFLHDLQTAVREHDKKWIANNTTFPFWIWQNNPKKLIKSKREFYRNYDIIITKKIERLILNQRDDNIFKNDIGLMFGRGDLWIGIMCKKTCVGDVYYNLMTFNDTSKLR